MPNPLYVSRINNFCHLDYSEDVWMLIVKPNSLPVKGWGERTDLLVTTLVAVFSFYILIVVLSVIMLVLAIRL